MRPHIAVAGVLAAAVLITASAAPVAARPGDDTIIAHFSYATVEAGVGGLWDCEGDDAAGATLSFGYVEGDRLQAPIGSGQPTTWSDVEPFVQIYGCDGAYYEFWGGAYDLLGQFDPSQVMIETYKYAALDVEVPLYAADEPTGISAAFDVTWVATGAPVVIHEGVGLTREASAQVMGSVTFYGFNEVDPGLAAALGNPSWDGAVTFPLDDAWGSLGRRVGTTHP